MCNPIANVCRGCALEAADGNSEGSRRSEVSSRGQKSERSSRRGCTSTGVIHSASFSDCHLSRPSSSSPAAAAGEAHLSRPFRSSPQAGLHCRPVARPRGRWHACIRSREVGPLLRVGEGMEVTPMKTMEERVSQLEKSTGAPATDGARLHAEHASTEIAELTVALGGDAVTFHDVARAWFGAHDEKLAPQERSKYREMFPDLLAKFTSTRGGIESDYFCEHIKVAAVLTDIDQAAESLSGVGQRSRDGATRSQKREHASASAIYIEPLLGEPSCWESKALLSQALDLHDRALEFLRPEHRKVCVSRIFRIITWTLGTLDNRAARTPGADVRLE